MALTATQTGLYYDFDNSSDQAGFGGVANVLIPGFPPHHDAAVFCFNDAVAYCGGFGTPSSIYIEASQKDPAITVLESGNLQFGQVSSVPAPIAGAGLPGLLTG
jgi:hypothetical protein